MSKWCDYCRKADHDDAECWCTRAVHSEPLAQPSVKLKTKPSKISAAVTAVLRGCDGLR